MSVKQITNSVYQIPLGPVNCYIVDDGDELTLIDTGFKGNHEKIFAALAKMNKQPADIRHIILTQTQK